MRGRIAKPFGPGAYNHPLPCCTDLAADLPVPPDGARVGELLAAVGQEEEVERLGWQRPSR